MAQTLGELVLKLQLDQAQFQTQLKKIEADTKQASTTFNKMGMALKALPIAAAAAALYQFSKSIAKASSDAQEANQKFNVVFSGIQVKANAMALSLAESFALSNLEVKEMLSNTGNILQGFGFAGDASLDLSAKITALGADLISFTNNQMGVKGATDAITKAMLGEREQMKSLGIAILDADLIRIAKDQGKNYEAMTKQEKAMLTFNQILKLSGNAVGDFARSMDSPANTLRAVTARMEDMKVKLGNELTPALTYLGRVFLQASKDGGVLFEGFKSILKVVSLAIIGIGKLINLLDYSKAAGRSQGAVNALTDAVNTQKKVVTDLREKYSISSAMNDKEAIEAIRLIKLRGGAQSENAKRDLAVFDQNQKNIKNITKTTLELKEKETDTFSLLIKKVDAYGQAEVTNSGKMKQASKDRALVTAEEIRARIFYEETLAKASGDSVKIIEAGYQKQYEEANKLKSQLNSLYTDGYEKVINALNTLKSMDVFKEQINKVNSYTQSIGGAFTNLFSSIQALNQANSQAMLDSLEAEKQARMEAAGVAEDTAVMKAQSELTEAEASGNAQLIGEKKRALEKAKIEEEFNKKKMQLEYQAAVQAWELNVATTTAQAAMGIMSAITSGAQWGGYAAIAGIAILGSLATAAAAIQIAAVAASKPKAPRFEDGGIVGGSMFTGDNVVARVNSGEMILNQQQQAKLFEQANTGGGGDTTIHNIIQLDGQVLYENLSKATFDGRLLIAGRAVV